MSEDCKRYFLDEARRILAKETMMLAQKQHLEAMADFIDDLAHSLSELLALMQKHYNLTGVNDPAWPVMVKARARMYIAETFEPDYTGPSRCSKCGEEVDEGVKVCRDCKAVVKWIDADHRMDEQRDRRREEERGR